MKTGYFKNNAYIIKLLWSSDKRRFLFELFYQTQGYAYWVFYDIVFIKFLVGSMENGRSFGQIMGFIILSMLGFALPAAFAEWYERAYQPKSNADIFEHLNLLLFEKASEVELECYENTEFYNKFTLAMKDCESRFSGIIGNICIILTSTAAAVFSLVFMMSIDPFVILFIAAPVIGNFVFGKMLNDLNYKLKKEQVPYVRRTDYVNRVIYLEEYAKELRITNIFRVLRQIYQDGFRGQSEKIGEYAKKRAALSLIRNIFTFVIIFQGIMIYSIYKTMVLHTISLSGFTVLFSAMSSVAWMIITASKAIIQSYEDSLYIANMREFLEYQPKVSEKQTGLLPDEVRKKRLYAHISQAKQGTPQAWQDTYGVKMEDAEKMEGVEIPALEFREVSFVYRGQQVPILKKISMRIHEKEKIAIVGHNGAGKTTFIKLLMRLYDVTEGEIAYFGTNIKELDLPQYRRLFGTAFQDYRVFAMTVAENVLMQKTENDADYDKARDALKRAGVWEKIQSLPEQMDTVLTKEFAEDGAVLSGGELQKVAVARAFAGDYSIAVFDEPSSALDPVAEYRLYENILEACRDKTLIFISHRLSTAVLADRIYLFENGMIAEEGSHRELMEKDGKYADMFRKQADNYQIATQQNPI